MTPLLQLTDVSKSFAAVKALTHVSFELKRGEVHALVGENGAGKSTLTKIITGACQPDSGVMEINGLPIEKNDPIHSRALGIAAIHQQPALFGDLSVMENIALGLEKQGWFKRVQWKRRRRHAQELLARIGAKIDPGAIVDRLTMPEQQLVEIARALGADARVLIMDEPTASLSQQEVERLFEVIRSLRAKGVGIIYISHRLEELPLIADRVTVLRDGKHMATRAIADVDRSELIRLMVGRELTAIFSKQPATIGPVVLETRGLNCRVVGIHDIMLCVRAGEIVGLAGLMGSGRTELAGVLFGLTPADGGDIYLHARRIAIRSPREAVEAGIAYVPEDRRRHGVIADMAIAANTSLAILKKVSSLGWLNGRKERKLAKSFVERLQVKAPSLATRVGNLSGGNQQKVAMARWLATEPAVLILDEPTQGVDIGAKAEIHRLMGELASQGLAILMISSELPEILGMSDRIAVMHRGTIAGILERAEATQEKILSLALEARQRMKDD